MSRKTTTFSCFLKKISKKHNMYKCKFFNITELVSQQVFYRYGEFAWGFFTNEFKGTLNIKELYNNVGLEATLKAKC